MRQFRNLIFITALMAAASWAVAGARAQESIPALTLDAQSLRQGGGGFVQDERPTFNYQNPYLNETLILQYQNILLERMVQRQNALARTEKAFMDVGVPFTQPPPPRGICEQLPVNVPCYKAYPDLFPGAVPEIAQIDQQIDSSLNAIDWKDEGSSTPPPPPEVDMSAYRWAEITCAGGQCVAVVAKNGARRTVREGDSLEDGIRVSRVTATGVDVSKDGKKESLMAAPAPSRGGAASPKYAGASFDRAPAGSAPVLSGSMEQQSRQLEDHFSVRPAESPAPEIGSVPVAASPSTPRPAANNGALPDHGPPLGPTGLF